MRLLWLVTDSVGCLLALAVLWVLTTAGGQVPVFGAPALPLRTFPARVTGWYERLSARAAGWTRRDLNRYVLAIVVITAALKVFNALAYPGFFSGDDVEVHEMTFARLFGYPSNSWSLRSPFFPFAFIYPVQRLLVLGGITDTRLLVIAGRLVVIAFSSAAVWLLFRVAVRRLDDRLIAAVAVLFFGFSRLQLTFGSAEFPRPVATLFILAAYGCLLPGRRVASTVWAGALLAIGGTLRFGEYVFLAPALATLALERRWRDSAVMLLAFGGATVCLLSVSDGLYWGAPLYSLRHAVDYTIVQRLSSRGYEPIYEYVLSLGGWSNLVYVALSLAALGAGARDLVLWTWAPVAILSLLPHKEPRYLVAVGPFLAMSAALGLRHLLARLAAWGDERRLRLRLVQRATWLLVLCAVAALLFEASAFRFRRSASGISVARYITAHGGGGAAVEQLWRAGGHLYLRNVHPLVDLQIDSHSEPNTLDQVLDNPEVRWIAVHRLTGRANMDETLARAGFDRAFTAADSVVYDLYERRTGAPSASSDAARGSRLPGRPDADRAARRLRRTSRLTTMQTVTTM